MTVEIIPGKTTPLVRIQETDTATRNYIELRPDEIAGLQQKLAAAWLELQPKGETA